MGDSTHEDELFEVGKEVAEEAEEYPEADNEDLAGLGGEQERFHFDSGHDSFAFEGILGDAIADHVFE
jgi:hypothetical protein